MKKNFGFFFKETLRRIFVRLIYPTHSRDWYKQKGYTGVSYQSRFNDFVTKQSLPNSLYYKEFKSLKLTRKFIMSHDCKIDSVEIKPSTVLTQNKPGEGLYIVFFLGKKEYYESRFRDMALFAQKTGATIIGFNPKGLNSSTGRTKVLSDIVNDGVALVDSLLARNINHKKIVFYGNSLGAAIQELVCKHFRKLELIDFRQINSNSFYSLAAVLSINIKLPFLERSLTKLMKYIGWEMDYEKHFYKTSVYRCFLTRKGDKVIKPEAFFRTKINILQDIRDAPEGYKESLAWLNKNSELIQIVFSKKELHTLSLNQMCLAIQDNNGHNITVWYFINQYLESSNKFV